MPRNGSGVFSLVSVYLAVTGQTATAAQHNEPLEDIRDDLNAARPIVAGGTGANNASDARANLGVTALLDGTSEIAPDLTFEAFKIGGVAVTASAAEINKLDGLTADAAELNKTDGLTGNILTDAQTDALTKGFTVTPFDAGTKTSGSFQPDPAENNMQYAINGGAHTLSPPASDCTIVLHYTNNGSAGAIATTGFDRVDGTFTTTDTDKFMCYITRLNGSTTLDIRALQ